MAKLENYNGSVQLIAGITQKGGGDFALIDANAVQTQEDGKRLDAELEEIKEAIQNIPAGGGTEQVQSDWKQDDETQPDYIKNKPQAGKVFTTEVEGNVLVLEQNDAICEKGDKGDTPEKGVDYFTQEDKEEIANELAGEYVKKTDYAVKGGDGGIVKVNTAYGVGLTANNELIIQPAGISEITNKNNSYKPITTDKVDYATMMALTTPKTHTWTDEQKLAAQNTIGVSDKIKTVEAIAKGRNSGYVFQSKEELDEWCSYDYKFVEYNSRRPYLDRGGSIAVVVDTPYVPPYGDWGFGEIIWAKSTEKFYELGYDEEIGDIMVEMSPQPQNTNSFTKIEETNPQLGDNLYIVDTGVPDYWWDPSYRDKNTYELIGARELETQFVDVSQYVPKSSTSAEPESGAVAKFTDGYNARLKTGEPSDENDATPKSYVDKAIADGVADISSKMYWTFTSAQGNTLNIITTNDVTSIALTTCEQYSLAIELNDYGWGGYNEFASKIKSVWLNGKEPLFVCDYAEQIALVTPSGDYAMFDGDDIPLAEQGFYQFVGVTGTYKHK